MGPHGSPAPRTHGIYIEGARQDGYSTHQGNWRQEELTLVTALVVVPSFKKRNKELVATSSGSPMAHTVAQERGPLLAPSRISLTYSGLWPQTWHLSVRPQVGLYVMGPGAENHSPRVPVLLMRHYKAQKQGWGKEGAPKGTVVF